MSKFKPGDEVTVINTGDVWEGYTGTVVSEDEDSIITTDGKDLTNVLVKIKFKTDDDKVKYIIQSFYKSNLELINVNESIELNEDMIHADLGNIDNFKEFFENKRFNFIGLDYDQMYQVFEQDDGSYDYNTSDKDEISFYKKLEEVPCKIISCSLDDSFEAYNDLENNFNRCYWNVEFDNGDVLEGIPGYSLKPIDDIFSECLTESFTIENEQRKDEDFISDYVYFIDLEDNEIPTWIFASQIASSENIDESFVIQRALDLKYKVYSIIAPSFDKVIITAPKCDINTVYEDYANFLQGKVVINQIN